MALCNAVKGKDQLLYEELLLKSHGSTVHLARLLQRAAFYGRDKPELAADFVPAPLYMFQAAAIHKNGHICDEMKEFMNV